MKLFKALFITLLFLFSAISTTQAAEINVTTLVDEINDDLDCSLREAVIAANTNSPYNGCPAGEDLPIVDVINVPAGTISMGCNVDFNVLGASGIIVEQPVCGSFHIYESVVIQGAGKDLTEINANSFFDLTVSSPIEDQPNINDRIFTIKDQFSGLILSDFCDGECTNDIDVTIADLSMTGGYASAGGAVHAADHNSCAYVHLTLRRVRAHHNFADNQGGAVYVFGQLSVEDSDIVDNTAGYYEYYGSGNGEGGGIFIESLSNLTSCEFESNISGSTIARNNAGYDGGGLHIDSYNTVNITNTIIDANGTSHYGAGIFNHKSNLNITASEIKNGTGFTNLPLIQGVDEEQTAPHHGGGIYNLQGITLKYIEPDLFDLFVDGPYTLSISDTQIFNNAAKFNGGGISNNNYYFPEGEFEPDIFGGGTIEISIDSVEIDNSTISDNIVMYGAGGGIFNNIFTGPFSITQSTIANNQAHPGGGIFNKWQMEIYQSTISGNTYVDREVIPLGAESIPETHYLVELYGGGGIANMGSLALDASTVSGNSSIGSGAGVLNVLSELYLYLFDITQGPIFFPFQASGILDYEIATEPLPIPGSHLNNVTVTENIIDDQGDIILPAYNNLFVSNGGGIATLSGEISLNNTIVAGNIDTTANYDDIFAEELVDPVDIPETAPDCWVSPEDDFYCDTEDCPEVYLNPIINSGGYNLIGTNQGCSAFDAEFEVEQEDSDKVGSEVSPIDPLLGPLDDNGGPTLTHSPLKDSPAIDMANPEEPISIDDEIIETALGTSKPCLDVDQRSVDRPQDGDLDGVAVCDIGAVEVIVDCAGIPGGENKINACGKCALDDSGCVAVCNEQDIFENQIDLDGAANSLNRHSRKITRILRKLRSNRKAGTNLLNQSDAQYQVAWTSTWAISSIIKTDCTGGVNCIAVNNVPQIQSVIDAVQSIYDTNKALIKKAKNAGATRKRLRKLRRKNNRLFDLAQLQANLIPASSTQCS